MNDLYERLKKELSSRLPPGAPIRLSLREDSLFASDLRRFPGALPPGMGWRAREAGGVWFFSPEAELSDSLCPEEEDPAFPSGPAGRFARLLYIYREDGPAEESFTLLLLRVLGRAHFKQKADVLLPPLKAAYARGLAAKKKIRTRTTAMIALEAARLLEGDQQWMSL
ncbi:MAG: hypothetical protein IKI84_14390 [Clostridia bacterium]|nr:hypothetical protein [Clostridia bacterium]